MTEGKNKIKRYWDANCMIALIKEEGHRTDVCAKIYEAAQRNETEIVISPMTILETLRDQSPIRPTPQSTIDKIEAFFERFYGGASEGLTLQLMTPDIARNSQRIFWKSSTLQPKDILHIAFAIDAECDFLETTDDRMIGEPSVKDLITIRKPEFKGQLGLERVGKSMKN